MRRLLRLAVCTTLAIVLTGSGSLLATAVGFADGSGCTSPQHLCHRITLDCACCFDQHDSQAPAPSLPSSERTTMSKLAASHSAIVALVTPLRDTPRARVTAPSRHRAGPPRSLLLLHATFLL